MNATCCMEQVQSVTFIIKNYFAVQMMGVKELKQLIFKNYPAAFCSIFMRVGTANGIEADTKDGEKQHPFNEVFAYLSGPKPSRSSADAVKALQVFFQTMEETDVLDLLAKEKGGAEQVWKGLQGSNYDDFVTTVGRAFCTIYNTERDRKRPLLKFLIPYLDNQSYQVL